MKNKFVGILLIIAIILQSILIYKIFENTYIQYNINNDIKRKENQIEEAKGYIKEIGMEKQKINKEINIKIKQKEEIINKEKKKRELEKRERDKYNNGEKIVYLTFDDGPSSNTRKILDILKDEKINGTFFVKGSDTEYSKELYKRIVEDGNAIGNHTYSHNYSYIYKSKENFIKDFNKLQNIIKETTGIEPKIMRFPGGSNNTVSHNYGGTGIMKEIINYFKQNNYIYYDWNVDSTDASKALQSKERIVNSVIYGSKDIDKIIVLMHDSGGKTTTVEALPEIIKSLKERGYKFKTLSPSEFRITFAT
ncbi:polysaccharide deacetylase family protein [Hathewaya histolytica]|uniref:Peptidoglycan N-acetylglucosamine deacetylase n=1 Tax=Hathewaya histolytica TaxID=1498 RepID=A0A4U9RK12_HATHI|nr:polysaccharide deacetylase family protein [Hathewaya histolytica]VTQ92229.1 peptidoglycan N-acetylglucosamine deacetylase [Hathewaya histolytica]